MDENQFFKQATLLICSSLDIATALHRCMRFIAEHIPVDWITLNIFEPEAGGLRCVAAADIERGYKMDMVITLPDDLISQIQTGKRFEDRMVINRPYTDPLERIVTETFDRTESSLIVQRMLIEGKRLGVINLFADGFDRYTPEHARWLALLREPFAIAMANALQHDELLQLKELLISDNRYLNSELLSQAGDEVIGADTGLHGVMRQVGQVAHLNNTVLILGETGTGKEVVATAIHRLSPRNNAPYIKVNCGAIPESLIDSELFGHEKGAFTGAVKQKRGLFERASGGTLFLDEIGELPAWAQVRLLRVLQTREIERVGGSPPIKLDIRVIVATHRNLEHRVAEGSFRKDLWFRINSFPILIPPLRERKSDIALIVQYFVSKKSKAFGIQPVPAVTRESLERLSQYSWPGNVRELENVVERALIQHRHGPLSFDVNIQLPETEHDAHSSTQPQQLQPLNNIIRDYIETALKACGGKVNGPNGLAEALEIQPNTLRHRMRKLGIPFGQKKGLLAGHSTTTRKTGGLDFRP